MLLVVSRNRYDGERPTSEFQSSVVVGPPIDSEAILNVPLTLSNYDSVRAPRELAIPIRVIAVRM